MTTYPRCPECGHFPLERKDGLAELSATAPQDDVYYTSYWCSACGAAFWQQTTWQPGRAPRATLRDSSSYRSGTLPASAPVGQKERRPA